MTKYVEWNEPWQYGTCHTSWVNVTSRMTVEDAIRYQRGYCAEKAFYYKSDEDALADFLTIHWAKIIEVYEE